MKKTHGLLVVHSLSHSLPFQTKLLNSYGSLGKTKYARMAFDRIPQPDLYSRKTMLNCYLMNDYYVEAIRFYGHMREYNRECDNVVFAFVLKVCIKLVYLDEGKKLHCHIFKVGNLDCFLLIVFIDMYAKCGDLESSMRPFEEIPEANVVSWTLVITHCNQNDRPEDVLVLLLLGNNLYALILIVVISGEEDPMTRSTGVTQ